MAWAAAARFGIAVPAGVRVMQVVPGGPAEKAGLRAGDAILSAGGHGTPSVDAIHRILDRNSAGRQSEPRVLRRGEVVTARITPERRPEDRRP